MLARSDGKMKLENQFYSATRREQASARVVLLALISFGLGVAATAAWFQLAAKREASNPVPQAAAPASAAPSAGANSSGQPFVEPPAPVTPEAVAELKSALPNYASLSLEQGMEILRRAALKKFYAATEEMQSQVAKAQAELSAAESNSTSDQQGAMKHLQEVQAEQSQKLQQIAGDLQTQIAALKSLKSQP